MSKKNKVLLFVILFVIVAFLAFILYTELSYQTKLQKYPYNYLDYISAFSAEYGLEPFFVLSVIRCESSFDPNAVSSRGAVGLMQIMPETGKWIAHKLDMDRSYKEELLYDPETNIRFGCWYLHFLNGRFHNDSKSVICAYNAGHGTVEKWLDSDVYSENGRLKVIPYPQTERYFNNVTEAYSAYKELYPNLFG